MPPAQRDNNAHGVACFVSPHGFGHAARLCAVADAVHQRKPGCRFTLFTSVPAWFFRNAMAAPFAYHEADIDLGLVQQSPFTADLPRTIEKLDELLPFDPDRISYLSYLVRKQACELILCDISPLGLAVGRQTGLPTVLIENFTWDWLYEGYLPKYPELEKHIRYLKRIFGSADYHVQAQPVCLPQPADLTVGPIWRKFRSPPDLVRKNLGVPVDAPMVLVTIGGVPGNLDLLDLLRQFPETWFVLPAAGSESGSTDNLILLPKESPFYHPDLVNASDAVVGKVGYSTLAEVYGAGVPFGYISRSESRESGKLAGFIRKEMIGLAIEEAEFADGSWTDRLNELLAMPRQPPRGINGADQTAEFICRLMKDAHPDPADTNGRAAVENHPDQR